MKKKTTLILFITCITAIQLSAQCRLVRIEFSDTSETDYLSYDKLGRLSAYTSKLFSEGTINQRVYHFAYNDKDKLMSDQVSYNDTVFRIRNYIYNGDVIKHIHTITPEDSVHETGKVFYNERGQVSRYFSKKTNGDTVSIRYDYAPEGWVKQVSQQSNKLENCLKIDIQWDANQNIIDEPARIFFAGYAISPMNYWIIPIEPLSVKGNMKSSTFYKMTKEGKFEKNYEGEVFDLKANAEGLWIENKWRDGLDNKVITCRAFYEGCKN